METVNKISLNTYVLFVSKLVGLFGLQLNNDAVKF